MQVIVVVRNAVIERSENAKEHVNRIEEIRWHAYSTVQLASSSAADRKELRRSHG